MDAWPLPPVDLDSATRAAKDRLHNLRRSREVRAGKAAIVEKHASRKVREVRSAGMPRRAPTAAASTQLTLGFE